MQSISKTERKTAKEVQIIGAAAIAFGTAGFKRTQMAEIAEAANVALGTLYRYTDSKEELFSLALAYGAGQDAFAVQGSSHNASDVSAFLEGNLARWFSVDSLIESFSDDSDRLDFITMVSILYDAIEHRRIAIRILDRSARDWPDVSQSYVLRVVNPILDQLASALGRLQAQNKIRPLHNTEISARFILETCSWFAMHRLFSPSDLDITDEEARLNVLDHLVASFELRNI